jgi:DNA repair protein RecN (Recombination protein N)
MLTDLVVEGLGVIDRAELHLTTGSSALTGETGAGKTLLVAALGLLLGARSDKTLVRQGSTHARVDARFELSEDSPTRELLVQHGVLEPTDAGSEVVLSRSVAVDGRSKARVNGRPVTLSILQDIGRSLVEIAGQNEHHALSSPTAQRGLLDAAAGVQATELAEEVSEQVTRLEALKAQLQTLRDSDRDRERELDVLRIQIQEIEAARPTPGEIDGLTATAGRLEHADVIAAAIGSALDGLKGEGGAGEVIARAERGLGSIADKEPSAPALLERLSSVAVEVADIAEELSRTHVQADPSALAAARERLALLSRLIRKYGVSEEEVLAFLDTAHRRVSEIEGSSHDEDTLTAEIAAVEQLAVSNAHALSRLRLQAAHVLEEGIEGMLKDLSLGDARFEVELTPRDLYAGGLESVGFLIAANLGESPKPLGKVASGGELSRIALALRLLTSTGTATTLVFDEVDAGVGGEAARSVGRLLAELGERENTQVLVVTHLPQVAAFADHQYRVSKVTAEDRTASLVEPVEGEDRVEELSRMLAGLPESERAREHAQELLELAGRDAR